MYRIIRKSPLLIFFYIAIVLTQSSLLFPQSIGKYQKVAGWPLTMHKTQYRLEGKIEATGGIVHNLIEESKQIIWGRVIINVIVWTIILQGTWLVYNKFFEQKTSRLAKN